MNELPSCSRTVRRKARKDHTCSSCQTGIEKGTRYTFISGIWDGSPRSFKLCENCDKVISNFKVFDENLDWDQGPSLALFGVSEWLTGFIYNGWREEEAAQDIAKLFDVPIEYARMQIGVNPIKCTTTGD